MKRTELVRKTPLRAVATTAPRVPATSASVALRATAIKASGKRLRQTRSTPPVTKAQTDRWDRMRGVGCIVCGMGRVKYGYARVHGPAGRPEIHHLTSGGRRRGHDATLCLCRYHHQGDELPDINTGYRAHVGTYGPSFGRGRKSFQAIYGTDNDLLFYQDKLLALRFGDAQ